MYIMLNNWLNNFSLGPLTNFFSETCSEGEKMYTSHYNTCKANITYKFLFYHIKNEGRTISKNFSIKKLFVEHLCVCWRVKDLEKISGKEY